MLRAPLLTLLLVGTPGLALAEEPAPADATTAPAGDTATNTPPADQAASATATPDDAFKIKRGFFAESDLGLFMTFGGRNTNNPDLPARGVSNVQPHLGVTVGYDVVHGPKYNFSLGVKLAMGFSGGAGRATESEIAEGINDVTTKSNDYTVIETGIQAAFSYLVTDRLALTLKADGGGGFLDPDPTVATITEPPCPEGANTVDNGRACITPGSGSAAFAPMFGAGIGVEYFTLLNDFSVGVTLRFAGILKDGMIPAASATFPIKYTF
ncbi:adventurous gliding motility protein CglE [Myxococcota bacterium]|nr:adventurous gliding motility protein CglE [Myxococcota bacterium]